MVCRWLFAREMLGSVGPLRRVERGAATAGSESYGSLAPPRKLREFPRRGNIHSTNDAVSGRSFKPDRRRS